MASAAAILLVLSACSADRPAKRAAAPGLKEPPPAAASTVRGAAAGDAATGADAGPASPPPAPLKAGEPQEGDLAGGERRVYPVELAAGDYARFYAEQRLPGDPGIDLALTLLAPGGAEVAEVASPGGAAGGELLSTVVGEGGTYRLVLTAADPAAPRGRYRVKLDERRAGKPGDGQRVAAEKLIHEASQLRTLETEEADTAALEKLSSAIPIASATGAASLEGDARSLIGQIHLTRGRLEEAQKAYEQALAAYDRAGDSHGRAVVKVELGLTSKRLGRIEEALEYYRSALPILHEVGDFVAEANTWHSMGVVAMSLGDLGQANNWLHQALALWRDSTDLDGEATALISLSRLELRRGQIDQAREYVELALKQSRNAEAKATQAYCLKVLGSIERLNGDFQAALSSYQNALETYRLMGNSREEANVLNYIGIVYLDLGVLDLAQGSFDEALRISSTLGLIDADLQALSNLGFLKAKERMPQSALAYYERALPKSRQLSDRYSEAVTLRLIGGTLLDLGRFDDAIRSLIRALDLQLELKDLLSEAYTRLVLGNVYLADGQQTAAFHQLERTLELSKELQVPLVESQARLGIARINRLAGKLEQAQDEVERSVTTYENLRSSVASDQFRTTFFSTSQAYYEFYLSLLMEMARREPAGGYIAAAFGVSERARARGLLDLLAESRIDVPGGGIAPETKAEEQRLRGRIRATEQLLSEALARQEPKSSAVEELRSELRRREDELRRLELRIQTEAPHYAELRHPRPLGLEEVQSLLGEGQAFLEFSVGARSSYLFAVTKDRFAVFELPSAADLQEETDGFRAAIINPDRRARGPYVLAARRLYDVLIAPAEEILNGKSELLISPDGALYYVPFEALLTARPTTGTWGDLPYLFRDRSISYVPSASVLASLAASEGAPRRNEEVDRLFVAFADPDYGSVRGNSEDENESLRLLANGVIRGALADNRAVPLARLASSAIEVRQLAEMFGVQRSAVYLQGEATETNVKTSPYLENAQWVHFATHGLIDEERPERSGLALTPTPDSSDLDNDGVLRVGEIFNLALRADLVVLSACDTGLGKVLSGEGMMGLTRAFLYAGAKSLVVSLWEVEDSSTARLMVAFKRHMDEGAGKAEALRQAKLELLAAVSDTAPRIWAPFVLVGDRN